MKCKFHLIYDPNFKLILIVIFFYIYIKFNMIILYYCLNLKLNSSLQYLYTVLCNRCINGTGIQIR